MVIAAHPDDEILGCAGTIAKSVKEGFEAFSLILGEGVTSRDKKRNRSLRDAEIQKLQKSSREANKSIGIKKVFMKDFPDNRFDTIALLDIVKSIEDMKNEIKPQIIYTHSWGDLNIDHRITYEAVLTAFRPSIGESVKEMYSFEVPSSTDWYYPNIFNPDTFVDITDTFDKKIRALGYYKEELRKFPHPRSLEGVKIAARNWGMRSGLQYAEAFKSIRIIR